jgi:hypothetical protein
VYLQKKKELYINNLIKLKLNPIYTINIIIIYRRKLAKHDSVHINFCRLPRNSAIIPPLPYLMTGPLVFNSLLQILKFSEPYYFLASRSLFGAPCSKKEQKILFAGLLLEPRFLNFGASRFF